jgi:hypothetical protein
MGVHFPPVRARDNLRRCGVPAKTDQQHNDAAGSMLIFYKQKRINMNTDPSSQKENAGNEKPSEEIQESIYPDQFEINITDGGEFLDDAIRMKDQPLEETNAKEINSLFAKQPGNGSV